MIRSSFLRIGAVVLGAVGMLAIPAPTAQAEEVGQIVFTGNYILDGPLGYPCNPTTPATPTKPCPPTVTLENKDGIKNTTKTNIDPGGNRRAFAFAPSVCAYAYATVGNAGKAPAASGTCTMTNSGIVTGYCGLALFKGTATIRLGVQTFVVRWWGQEVARTVVLKFEGTKRTNNGPVTGEVQGELTARVVPVPVLGGPPPTTLDNSCVNKTADNFTMAAEGSFVVKSLLP